MHMHDMDMAMSVPSSAILARDYWAVIGSAIALAALVNLLNLLLLRQRLSSSHARPHRFLPRLYATATAISREFSNTALCGITLGRLALVAAELVVVLVLCFYGLDLADAWSWEDVGYRTGYISATQLPLVVLLAGKRNILAWLIGSSYERLNWLHRWISRILFLTVTIHMFFWFRNWAQYDYISTKLSTDKITQRGFAAWVILLWITLSSSIPLRRWNYEFFVLQHILSFIGFLAAVYLHLPTDLKVYVWIPVAVYALDRLVRFCALLHINFRPSRWSCRATLEPLAGDVARLSISPAPLTWTPGQHVFLSCHGIAPLQSHPFTIASIPADGRLDFLIKSRKGATRRFSQHALQPVLSTHTVSALVEGPYGRIRSLRQFDSVFLIAGSTGSTFTMPLLRDLVACWQSSVTRHVQFVWVVKASQHYQWWAREFSQLMHDVDELRQAGEEIVVDIGIYVTCDQSYTIQTDSPQTSCPSAGCCCTRSVTDTTTSKECHCHDSSQSPLLGLEEKPMVRVTSGRPQAQPMIRQMLEQAEGESAVVVCGPPTLIADVRRSVVGLCDERAVHKGTGAQGVYLWAEEFGY